MISARRTCVPLSLFVAVSTLPAVAHAEDASMSLAQAYKLALKYNDQIAVAESEATTQKILLNDTWSEVHPTVTLVGDGFVERNRYSAADNSAAKPLPGLEAGVVADQPLYRRGFFAGRDAGRLAVDSANATVGRARQQLAKDVADVYITVVRTRAIVTLSQGAVDRSRSQYDHAVARVNAGNTLKTAQLLAQVDVKRAERQLTNAKRDERIAEVAFARIVGKMPPPALDLPPVPEVPPPDKALPAAANRPDLQALSLSADASYAAAEAARGKRFWPQLDFQASATYSNTTLKPADEPYNLDWRAMLTVTIPLVQSGHEITEIKLRENDAHIAELELEHEKKVLAEQVAAGAVLVESSADYADIAKKQLDTAKENYDLVDKQFKLGAITFLEVTTATNALAESELAYEVARTEKVRAVYNYLFVIGNLDPVTKGVGK